MIVKHQSDGSTVVDTQTLRALTTRSTTSVRRLCQRGPDGYDLHAATAALAAHPDEPVLLTAPDAARYLRIPTGTVYSWQSRGVLRSWERNGRGQPLYDVADLTHLNDTRPGG